MEQQTLIEVPRFAGNDDENFRFTLPRADAWLRRCAQVDAWDLDAAACHESHLSPKYYTLERGEDGLMLPWVGATFINPPWDDIEPWVMRAWQVWNTPALYSRPIAMLLPLRTHMDWWQKWVAPFRDGRDVFGEHRPLIAADAPLGLRLEMHEAPERFAYGCPGNPRGVGAAEPNFQSVGLVWRLAAC